MTNQASFNVDLNQLKLFNFQLINNQIDEQNKRQLIEQGKHATQMHESKDENGQD